LDRRDVKVHFLIDPSDPNNAEAVSNAKKEIQFYLIDKKETDPWAYAQYHAGTASNAYSETHWSFLTAGNQLAQGE
jgi:hypothetical protein